MIEAFPEVAREPALFRRRSPVLDRGFLQREQTIDVYHVRAEGVARLLSASDGVEDRAVFGAHAVGANVCVMSPSYLCSHRCVPFLLLTSFDTDRRQRFTHDRRRDRSRHMTSMAGWKNEAHGNKEQAHRKKNR